MATTESGIWTPDSDDDYSPVIDLAAMADSIEGAIEDVVTTLTTNLTPVTYGWTALETAPGWTANTGNSAPRIKRIGDTVTYQGGVYGSGSPTFQNLPSWSFTGRQLVVPIVLDTGDVGTLTIFTSGVALASGNLNTRSEAKWTV